MAEDPRTLHITQAVTYRCRFNWLLADGVTPASLAGFKCIFELLSTAGEGNEIVGFTFDSSTGTEVVVEPGGAVGEIDVRLGADLTVTLGPLVTDRSVVPWRGRYALLAVSTTDPTEVELIADGPFVYILEGT